MPVHKGYIAATGGSPRHLPRQSASVSSTFTVMAAQHEAVSGLQDLEWDGDVGCGGKSFFFFSPLFLATTSGLCKQVVVYASKAMMHCDRPRWRGLLLPCLLCVCALFLSRGAHGSESVGLPVLMVGEERIRETLAFFDGSSREYEVQGLQERKWYEIKISYPSCIPASIDIKFRQHSPDTRRRAGRRLLNTEKTVFYVTEDISEQAKTAGRATVEVHPAGVISKHLSSDHPFIIYNILCEEVILGIPKQAWWVGLLAALVLYSACHISARLPSTLVPANSRVVKDLYEAE